MKTRNKKSKQNKASNSPRLSKVKTSITNLPTTIKKRWKFVAIATLALILLGYYLINSQTKNEPTYTTTYPVRQDLNKTLTVSGVVDAKEKARMRFLSGGKVVYLGAQTGDWVNKWQTIATIDRRTVQKQLEQSLNSYQQERWRWENTLDTNKDETLDDIEKRNQDIEQFELNKSVIAVEMQNIAISDTGLYAPFAGILTQSPSTVAGVQLSPTDFFELVNPSSLTFFAQIDEIDIAAVRENQEATINLDAYPDQEISTLVKYISFTSAQTTTGTVFIVELPLDSNDLSRYRIGMNGEVTISLESKSDVLTIPIETTRERGDSVFVDVLIAAPDQIEEREIQTGMETDDLIEVVGGLSEEDQVVLPQ